MLSGSRSRESAGVLDPFGKAWFLPAVTLVLDHFVAGVAFLNFPEKLNYD